MPKTFKLAATVSSASPAAVKPALDRAVAGNGAVKEVNGGFEVTAEFKGESARDLNRTLLSEMRRAEKRTSIRSQWTCEGTTEKFFDYALKQTTKT